MKMEGNLSEVLSKLLVPDFYSDSIKKFDIMYDQLKIVNPGIADLLIKPSDLADTFKNEGLDGLT